MISSATFMTVGGVWSCRWRELKPISFGTGAAAHGGGGGDGGEYEMVRPPENGEVG